MLSEAIRRRLETLDRHGGPVPRGVEAPTLVQPTESADLRPLLPGRDRLEVGEVVENASGRHYRIRFPLDPLWHKGRQPSVVGRQDRPAAPQIGRHPELAALAADFPRKALFVDLETCGFAGSAVFLIGLLRHVDSGLSVELLLARDYAEERAILETFWSTVGDHRVLVTFNGKAFDWPMLCDRSTLHHLGRDLPQLITARRAATENHTATPSAAPAPPRSDSIRPNPWPQLVHCDLLYHARRRWRSSLPNCKLQTLEWHVCGRRRAGDIPGYEIPEAYHRFVRTGNACQLRSILHHNALDLVTLFDLAQRLACVD